MSEHEWNVSSRPEMPAGEDAVIGWELRRTGTERCSTLRTERCAARRPWGSPRGSLFLDRLEACLGGEPLPNWQERYGQVASSYPPSSVKRRDAVL